MIYENENSFVPKNPGRAPLPELDAMPSGLKILANKSIWVAWDHECRSSNDGVKKFTKILKNPHSGRNAKSNDPSSWGTFDQAYRHANRYSRGIGIVLTKLNEEEFLGGLDIDTCRNTQTNEIAPWAMEVIDRFNTYTEISPSETGVKLFFKIKQEALEKLKTNTKSNNKKTLNSVFKKEGVSSALHPPALELYLGGRYFTVTGDQLGENNELSFVTEQNIRWLLEYYGPKFAGLAKSEKIKNSGNMKKKVDKDNKCIVELDQVKSALNHIDPNSLNYPEWIKVGMALKSINAEDLWLDWCARYNNNNTSENIYVWHSFKEIHEITIASIFYKAKQNGWVYEKLQYSEDIINCSAKNDNSCNSDKAEFDTELGNARRLVEKHRGNIRFVHTMNAWYIWDGKSWVLDTSGGIYRLADETVEDLLRNTRLDAGGSTATAKIKFALKSQSRSQIENMVVLARHQSGVPLQQDKLDANPLLFAVQNGVVDLTTGKLMVERREDYLTKRAPVIFDPSAGCQNWMNFQNKISEADSQLISYKQRVYGLALSGKVEEVIFIMHGQGANGKSTESETIRELLGYYADAANSAVLISTQGKGGATPELASLHGKRAIFINETAENDVLNEARVKYLASNAAISARNLYQSQFTFNPTHKLFLQTNHKPKIRGTDHGIWRRIQYIPYQTTIPENERDASFREKYLIPELPGILNWMIEGFLEYQRIGLSPPPVVCAAAAEYRREQDNITQWIELAIEQDASHEPITLAELHSHYQAWMDAEMGWRGASNKRLAEALRQRGFESIITSSGVTAFRGIRLKWTKPAKWENAPF